MANKDRLDNAEQPRSSICSDQIRLIEPMENEPSQACQSC